MLIMLVGILPQPAYAEIPASPSASKDTCTNFKDRAAQVLDNPKKGADPKLLSGIYEFVVGTVNNATKKLFESFTKNPSYQNAVYWAIVLMLTFYGVGFTIGIVQPSFQQVLVRLIKVGIIFSLISPTGWNFFSQYVVAFFQNGTDDIIKGVQEIGTGLPYTATDTPFYALDRVIHLIIVARRVVRCEKNYFIERGDVYFIECEIEDFFYECGTGVRDKEGAHIF
jgi:hypothetical protein